MRRIPRARWEAMAEPERCKIVAQLQRERDRRSQKKKREDERRADRARLKIGYTKNSPALRRSQDG